MKISHHIRLLSLCAIVLCYVASCGKSPNTESESDRNAKGHEARLPAQGIALYEVYLKGELSDRLLNGIFDSISVPIIPGYEHSAEFAFVNEADTATVNATLEKAMRQGKFPSDVSCTWSYYASENCFYSNDKPPFALYFLQSKPALTSTDISSISKLYERENDGIPALRIRLTNDGAAAFARLTKDNIGRPIAITFNGKVLQAPVVNAPINGGSLEISTHGDRDTDKLFKQITRKLKPNLP